MRVGIVAAVLVLLGGQALAQGAPEPVPAITLVDNAGRPVPVEDFIRRVGDADFILIGETHLSACDHRAQASLIALLAQAGIAPAIGLEMVAVDLQRPLDLFNQRRIPAERMGDALSWYWNWGYPFSLYRPIFRTAQDWNLPVVALNVPDNVAALAADGRITAEYVNPSNLLPPEVIEPHPDQLPELTEEFERHGAFLEGRPGRSSKREPFERFVFTQSLWDTQMAYRALEARARLGRPVVVLAGTGHIEHGWGIPHRLEVLAPEARRFTVLPWRGGEPPPAGAADLFYSCAARAHP